jgi:hypothetical protein
MDLFNFWRAMEAVGYELVPFVIVNKILSQDFNLVHHLLYLLWYPCTEIYSIHTFKLTSALKAEFIRLPDVAFRISTCH